jgi:AraC family transcriptional regulator of arabinose operon
MKSASFWEGAGGELNMNEYLPLLLEKADLNIIRYDMNTRTEMGYYKRILPCRMVSYLRKGNAKLRVGNIVYDIKPRSVVFLPENLEHDHYKDSSYETEFMWWHFKFEVENVLDVLKIFSIPYVFMLQDYNKFEHVFEQFIESTKVSGVLPNSILKKARALELLYLILECALSNKEASMLNLQPSNFLGLLTSIIHSPEKQINLKELSKEMHMNSTYISNRFKELFGKSPVMLQRELKVQKAKSLLEISDLSITDIAYATGFDDVQSFSRLFKHYLGISPSQYRLINSAFLKR